MTVREEGEGMPYTNSALVRVIMCDCVGGGGGDAVYQLGLGEGYCETEV